MLNEKHPLTSLRTCDHVFHVQSLMRCFIIQLIERACFHDSSKFLPPELETFAEYTSKLKDSTYGSDGYKQFLKEMKPALDHHYKENRHHPEHFENGINDMTLVDLLEMACDWKAASARHEDGSIERSITINKERFDISDQLVQIIRNTLGYFDGLNSAGN